MTWKTYEKEIFHLLRATYKDADISFNQSLKGRYSKVDRQIDVLVEAYVAGKKIRLIVDGKYFGEKIDVKEVESFISMVEDVEAQQGVLITSKGYSSAAINRAYYGSTDIELDILNFDELKQFQGFGGIIHFRTFGAIVPAPFGWIIDSSKREGMLATFYQRGLTFKDALKNKEWMYVNIFSKDDHIKSMDDLVELQESYTKVKFPKSLFEYDSTIKRSDNSPTLLRTIIIDKYPTNEYTGFIEFDDFFVFFVLFSPIELKSKNLRKLENLIERTLPIQVDEQSVLKSHFDRLQVLIDSSTNNVQKAGLLIGQAEILTLLKMYQEAEGKYDESTAVLKTSYGAIKGKIYLALINKKTKEELSLLIDKFYDLDPTNPIVCTDLADLFSEFDRTDDLVSLFEYGSKKYITNKEAIGNFNYHLALLLANAENKEEAERHFAIAKLAFKDCLDEGHYIFGLIDQNLMRLKKGKP